jgi:Zn-dependent protease
VNFLGVAFFVLYWVVFVYSVVLHEVAHGYVAFRLGDTTAYKEGRITLDPFNHIDPFRSILMPLILFIGSRGAFIFGGAKPVPVNPYMYKNMRTGIITDAAAGPLTNVLLAMIFAVAFKISVIAAGEIKLTGQFLACCMMINIFLAIFNLLPVPPLDGSHILQAVLPRALAEAYEKLRYLGFMLIIFVLIVPVTRDAVGLVIGKGTILFLRLMGITELPNYNPMGLLNPVVQ